METTENKVIALRKSTEVNLNLRINKANVNVNYRVVEDNAPETIQVNGNYSEDGINVSMNRMYKQDGTQISAKTAEIWPFTSSFDQAIESVIVQIKDFFNEPEQIIV